MAVYKRGENWYIDIYVEGRRVRRKVGPDKRTAELAAKDVLVQAARGKWLGIDPQPRITFEEFVNKKFLPRMAHRAQNTRDNYETNQSMNRSRFVFRPFGRRFFR